MKLNECLRFIFFSTIGISAQIIVVGIKGNMDSP